MIPAGIQATRATLDALKTQRPIIVVSSFGHTALANSRAIELAGITPRRRRRSAARSGAIRREIPPGFWRMPPRSWSPSIMPAPTPSEDVRSAQAALDVMRKQGITTFLDAMALDRDLAAFAGAERAGGLTARAHFAVLITPPEGKDPEKAVAAVAELARRYDEGDVRVAPSLTVAQREAVSRRSDHGARADGRDARALFRAAKVREPMRRWAPGKNRGPDVYFPAPVLRALVIAAAGAGFEPHMHADGDRAVHEGLDAIEAIAGALSRTRTSAPRSLTTRSWTRGISADTNS